MKTFRNTCTATVLTASIALAASSTAMAAGSNDVRHLSGGVSDAGQMLMKDKAGNYNLGMTFSNQQGQYVAGVDVTIRDPRGGDVFSGTSDGPMLLVDLPAGRYEVRASHQGRTQSRQVEVNEGGHRQLVMRWDTGSPR